METWEEKPEKDFMITAKNYNGTFRKAITLAVSFIWLFSCSTGPTDDPIPMTIFADLTINLTAPEYNTLLLDGGTKAISSIGVRGVIIYRKNSTSYFAYERNCSYHPNDACATVNVHVSNLYLTDPCCNSNFSLADGSPTGGVAWRPLRRYITELVGNNLTITDNIAN